LTDDRAAVHGCRPEAKKQKMEGSTFPVDLDLELVLGDMPRKVGIVYFLATFRFCCNFMANFNLKI
jgi:hypothetical protein